jgi:hypothetical protein
MLLRDGRADSPHGNSQHPRRFAGPGTLAAGAGGMIKRIFQHTGKRTVVFRGYKKQALRRADVTL